MDRTVFITNSSACLNLRASDLRAPPPVEVISVGQIFLPSGSLPAVRGVAAGLICLLLCSQIECVHRGCVNGQKCGSAGTWRAGPLKRNFFQRLPDRTPCLSLLLCLVLCYLAQDGNLDVCVLFTSCTCGSPCLLGDNSRTLQMFIASLLVDVSSQSQFPAAC